MSSRIFPEMSECDSCHVLPEDAFENAEVYVPFDLSHILDGLEEDLAPVPDVADVTIRPPAMVILPDQMAGIGLAPLVHHVPRNVPRRTPSPKTTRPVHTPSQPRYEKRMLSATAKSSKDGIERTQRSIPNCYYCKEDGHVVQNCTKTPCRRCGKKGHKENECDTPYCCDCNRFGHVESDCWVCERCGRNGHREETCRTPSCETCGKIGHITEKCFSNLKCGLCLRRGHDDEHCRTDPWCSTCKDKHYPGTCRRFANRECATCGETGHDTRSCKSEYIWRQ